MNSTNQPKQKYDPYQSFLNRMTPAAKAFQSRLQQHQFKDSIGGDSSNYRKS